MCILLLRNVVVYFPTKYIFNHFSDFLYFDLISCQTFIYPILIWRKNIIQVQIHERVMVENCSHVMFLGFLNLLSFVKHNWTRRVASVTITEDILSVHCFTTNCKIYGAGCERISMMKLCPYKRLLNGDPVLATFWTLERWRI